MPETEYIKYASDSRKVWRCDRADCEAVDGDPFSALSSKLSIMMDKISHLATKDEMAAVADGMKHINGCLDAINKKLDELEPRLKSTEDRLDEIEDRLENVQAGASKVDPESVLEELNDRSMRARNLLVYNIPESGSPDVKVRVAHDNDIANKLIESVIPSQIKHHKTVRLGKINQGRPRPLKIIFNSDVEVRSFIANFDEENIKKLDARLADISIARDRTLRERQYLKDLRSELDKREKRGEKGLTIKYRNGVPAIVHKLQKN